MKNSNISIFTKKYLSKLKKVKSYSCEDYYKIYLLIDPIEMNVFYIGCTKEKISKRIYLHINECSAFYDGQITKKHKLQNLLKNEIEPIVKVLYWIEDKQTARIVEKYLINFCANNKYPTNLLNKQSIFSVNPF